MEGLDLDLRMEKLIMDDGDDGLSRG